MNNYTSQSRKGWWGVYVPPMQYFTGRMSNSNDTQLMLLIAMFWCVVPWLVLSKTCIMFTVRVLTWVVVESLF